MQLSPIVNLIGAILIVVAIVLHIVCLATPYWAGADGDQIRQKFKAMFEQKASEAAQQQGGMGIDLDSLQKDMEKAGMLGGSSDLSYGLWKMCIHAATQGLSVDFCGKWGSKTEADESGMVKSFKAPGWIRGVQAMAILGLLAAVSAAVLAGIHLFVPSRGDRLRLLPAFICVAAFAAGALVLCGDIIIGAKYEKVIEPLVAEEGKEKPPQFMIDIIEDALTLSWGFALDVIAAVLLFLSGLFYIVGGKAAQGGGGLV